MIDLYALTSPNVQKIFIMLEECELPYNIKLVDVWTGRTVHAGIHQDQSAAEGAGDRRSATARPASLTP